MTEYKGYLIEKDRTGYAPAHLKFIFYKNNRETFTGFGESKQDCKDQIDNF